MSNEPLKGENVFANVNDALSRVGGFGRFQQLLTACFSIMILPGTFSTLIMYFAALKPDWTCSTEGRTNTSTCATLGNENRTFPTRFASSDRGRCSLPRNEWEYTEPRSFSIVTQFDIYCDGEWVGFNDQKYFLILQTPNAKIMQKNDRNI